MSLIFIRRVEDQDGTILFEADSKPRRAVSETTAFMMATMLADVIDAGTANRARSVGFNLPAAGKTGTTNDFVDAWFVGFTPKLVAGVWVGFDKPRTILKNGFAGQLAVPMWARFMKAATRTHGPVWFEPPPDVVAVEVCRLSGHLPGAGCRNAASISPTGEITYKSMVYTDYFVRGTEPYGTCAVHAVEYLPYPEPYFAVSAFDNLGEAFGAIPEPAIAATAITAPTSGLFPTLPAAVPAVAPNPSRRLHLPLLQHVGYRIFRRLHQNRHRNLLPQQNPESALPPPAAPEVHRRRRSVRQPDYHLVIVITESYPPARVVAPKAYEHFSRHLAAARTRGHQPIAALPDPDVIERMINATFWASLRREEGYIPKISMAYLPPEHDEHPVRFERPVSLTPAALTKIAAVVERPGIHLGVWQYERGAVRVGHDA